MKKNKVALVTGASSGIGAATATRLAEAGYAVYGTSRRGAATGKRPFPILVLDVTSDASVDAVVSEVLQRSRRIDLLVNNAGFGVGLAGERMTRAVLPAMRRQARPKRRYPVGRIATLELLRRFAPGVVDTGIRRELRLVAPLAASRGAAP